MKAIVTGATGFVGKWLVKDLLEQGDEVVVIVRSKQRIPKEWIKKVHVVEATLEQYSSLENITELKKADLFFHLAWAGTAGMERANTYLQLMNVQYTCNAVRLSKKLGCSRFVNAGSIMEYEAMKYIPIDSSTPGAGNIYSTAKMTADFMAKTVANQEKVEYINIIISNIYGVGEFSARFLNSTLRKMIANEAIPLTSGQQLYDFIYVTDAVKQIIAAGKRGECNNSYYIGNAEQQSLRNYIIEMAAAIESRSELLFGSVPYVGAMLNYQEFNTGKILSLGVRPQISFAEGVRMVRDWIVEGDK